jgi:transcriptional regulator with XRE-family HTH domain
MTGAELRDARALAGKTQREVADMIGMSVRSVNDWENGGNLTRKAEVKIRAVLGDFLPPESSESIREELRQSARRLEDTRPPYSLDDARGILRSIEDVQIDVLPRLIAALRREQKLKVIDYIAELTDAEIPARDLAELERLSTQRSERKARNEVTATPESDQPTTT